MSANPRPPVLILEDDANAAAALATLLSDWGYEPLCAAGLAGLDAVVDGRGSEIRAVITDFHLDGCTGPEALERLTALGTRAPVLLMTGSLRGGARAAARAAGHGFLEKPADATDVLKWLKRAAGPGAAID